MFDVGTHRLAHGSGGLNGLRCAVHAGDGMATAGKPAQVAAQAAGHVQYRSAGRNQVRPALDPVRRFSGIVHQLPLLYF